MRGANDGISDVTTWGEGFVAVGSVEAVGGPRAGAVWFSEDGTGWSWVFVDEPPPGVDSEIGGVVAGGPGLVAAGSECTDVMFDCRDMIWTSPDGRSWSKTAIDPPGSDQARDVVSFPKDIAVGGPGLAVVGEFVRGRSDAHGAVWTSVDGITWTRMLETATMLTDGINLVAAGASRIVAVGTAPGGPTGERRRGPRPTTG